MKKIILLIAVVLLVFGSAAVADVDIAGHRVTDENYAGTRGLGIGIVFGETNGISVKNWVNQNHAFQFDANWDLYYGGIGFGVAYLFHNFEMLTSDMNKFPVYIGIKGWAAFATDNTAAGVQIPLGISWIPKETPIDIFLQVEPGISLIPSVRFAPGGGLGIRYWLN
jgi:hypothetical protein